MRAFLDLATLLRFQHLLRHPVELLEDDRLAAESGHEGKQQWPLGGLIQSARHLGVENASAADRAQTEVRLYDADDLESAQHVTDTVGRERTNRPQPHHADLRPAVAHVLDGVPSGD